MLLMRVMLIADYADRSTFVCKRMLISVLIDFCGPAFFLDGFLNDFRKERENHESHSLFRPT